MDKNAIPLPVNPYLMELQKLRIQMDSVVIANCQMGSELRTYMDLRDRFGELLAGASQHTEKMVKIFYLQLRDTCFLSGAADCALSKMCARDLCPKIKEATDAKNYQLPQKAVQADSAGHMPKLQEEM